MERPEESLKSFEHAIAINSGLAEAHNNKGFVLTILGRPAEALTSLDQAVQLQPGLPDAHNNRGVALRRLNRLAEAVESYDRAISLNADYGEAWSNRGKAFAAMQQLDAAAANFERAITLMPHHADTLLNGALAFQKKGRFAEANVFLQRLASVDPANKHLLFGLAYGALQQCNWSAQDALRTRLLKECPAGESIVPPLTLLGYLDEPEALYRSSTHYLHDLLDPGAFVAAPPLLRSHAKIRIAYVSGDFHEHATAYLMADLFERHDRSRFEVHGISFGPDDQSETRSRLRRAFDEFHDVASLSDAEVADLMRRLGVDIAIDLKGFTICERPGIFTRRSAPIQVNYLGYPGTMAADCWDYVIADATALPRAEQPFYSERIVHLADCYQANDPARQMTTMPARTTQNLPEAGFIFCCFNNHWKITKVAFETWMRLLKALPGSVLWLIDGSANDTLRREAIARGIEDGRLIFAPAAKQNVHLARLGLADLVLDTLPYNAHTTASDALWAGVPIVTCQGKSFAGRVAASLLTAMGLPELITSDFDSYEALAIRLSHDADYRASIRKRLAADRRTSALFDAKRFCASIEQAFVMMVEKAHRGDSPSGFDVHL